jgi:hypothetical protein
MARSVEAQERKRIQQKDLKRAFREKMKDEGKKSLICFIAPELHARLSELANDKYACVTKEDAIGRILIDRLKDI